MLVRENLIRLAIKHEGDYFRIRKALERKEETDGGIPLQQALTILDEEYPKKLLELKYPPYVLFYEGDIRLLKEKMISIVGSRESCSYGEWITREIIKSLRYDYAIVSGMAKGIDTIAHSSSRKTIGILGNGLDVIYPKVNEQLYGYMKKYQLLLSEYPYGVKPLKEHFPFRNRIIAALGEAVIVTQAKEKSGTMLTVNEALAINKGVYAVPYNIDDENGSGCNQLIQQGANVILWDFKTGGLCDFI
ncbi:MAG: DNA-processing protein DprA [Erysipelotrichaceae bacterium]|nr:DNA-processing protein DprA [Erysipelotrichaceae bacterium]